MAATGGRIKLALITVVAVGIVIGLSGCSGRGFSIPSEKLPACQTASSVRVEDLGPKATCDLEKSLVKFPDGVTLYVPAAGGVHTQQTAGDPVEYQVSNDGAWGVVAAKIQTEKKRAQWWGYDVAVKEEQQLLGY